MDEKRRKDDDSGPSKILELGIVKPKKKKVKRLSRSGIFYVMIWIYKRYHHAVIIKIRNTGMDGTMDLNSIQLLLILAFFLKTLGIGTECRLIVTKLNENSASARCL